MNWIRDLVAGVIAGWQTYRSRRHWRRRGMSVDTPF